MRTFTKTEQLRVASLKELDALVGKYLTQEAPQVYWEEQQVCLRFDSLQEALEAMHDPFFQEFIPKEMRPHSALTEVQEWRAYSSDLNLAWEVVERLGDEKNAFRLRRENGQWVASFGDRSPAVSRTAPVAICLAALRARGIEAELVTECPPVPAKTSAAA